MRKIRFRGRTEHGTWKFGDLIQYETGEMAILNKFSQFGYEAVEITNRYKVIPKTVGQYTGLKDKKNTRIYEGDIVIWDKWDAHTLHKEKFKIVWIDGDASFYGVGIDDETKFISLLNSNIGMEVVGSIFENPELTQ